MTVCMGCICVHVGISRRNSFKGERMQNPRKFHFFSQKGQNGDFFEIVQAKTWKFSRSRMMKRTSPLESSREI